MATATRAHKVWRTKDGQEAVAIAIEGSRIVAVSDMMDWRAVRPEHLRDAGQWCWTGGDQCDLRGYVKIATLATA